MSEDIQTAATTETVAVSSEATRPVRRSRFKMLLMLLLLLLTLAGIWLVWVNPKPAPVLVAESPAPAITTTPLLPSSVEQPTAEQTPPAEKALIPDVSLNNAPVPSVLPIPQVNTAQVLQEITTFEQRMWQQAPLLVELRANAERINRTAWYQQLWWQWRATWLWVAAQPQPDDMTVEATLKRIEIALRKQNAAAYAAALSQLRPAERALLEPLPTIAGDKS